MAQITYGQVGWEDKPSENTPINALNLGKMEQGIKDCVNKINGNLFASDGVEFKFSKSGSNYGYIDAGGNFVPFKTTHTETKTLSDNGTTDMGVDHKYRYVDASNVYSAGVSAGKAAAGVSNGQLSPTGQQTYFYDGGGTTVNGGCKITLGTPTISKSGNTLTITIPETIWAYGGYENQGQTYTRNIVFTGLIG